MHKKKKMVILATLASLVLILIVIFIPFIRKYQVNYTYGYSEQKQGAILNMIPNKSSTGLIQMSTFVNQEKNFSVEAYTYPDMQNRGICDAFAAASTTNIYVQNFAELKLQNGNRACSSDTGSGQKIFHTQFDGVTFQITPSQGNMISDDELIKIADSIEVKYISIFQYFQEYFTS